MPDVYAMLFEPSGVDRDAVLGFMEANDNVVDYHASIPTNLVIVVSPLTAEALTAAVKSVGNLHLYMFVRIDNQRIGRELFGWMPPALWEFVARHNQPKAVTPNEVAVPAMSQAVSVSGVVDAAE